MWNSLVLSLEQIKIVSKTNVPHTAVKLELGMELKQSGEASDSAAQSGNRELHSQSWWHQLAAQCSEEQEAELHPTPGRWPESSLVSGEEVMETSPLPEWAAWVQGTKDQA
eukprot:superscaffoldBa00002347_g13997